MGAANLPLRVVLDEKNDNEINTIILRVFDVRRKWSSFENVTVLFELNLNHKVPPEGP